MTTQEAIEILTEMRDWNDYITQSDALQMAIDELEKKPAANSEDAISRQAVEDAIYDYSRSCDVNYAQIMEYIDKIPSVSTEKTGRWIRWYEVIESADGKSTDHIPHCKCSECDCEYDTYSSQFIKYCPNCGAKMEVRNDERRSV